MKKPEAIRLTLLTALASSLMLGCEDDTPKVEVQLYATPIGFPAAESQLAPRPSNPNGPVHDLYVNSHSEKFNKEFSQGTILHEALHNLTHLSDTDGLGNDLKTFVGIEREDGQDPSEHKSTQYPDFGVPPGSTTDITYQLQQYGCAGTN